MYDAKLPHSINPLRLAQHADALCGYVLLSGMSRLLAIVDSLDEKAHVELDFALDEWNRPVAKGVIRLIVHLICQRCLKPMQLDLNCEVNWAFVKNDNQAKQIQEVHDPVLVENEKLDLLVQIEDEILLNLPMLSLHEDISICGMESKIYFEKQDGPTKKSPFEQLAKLKLVKKTP